MVRYSSIQREPVAARGLLLMKPLTLKPWASAVTGFGADRLGLADVKNRCGLGKAERLLLAVGLAVALDIGDDLNAVLALFDDAA